MGNHFTGLTTRICRYCPKPLPRVTILIGFMVTNDWLRWLRVITGWPGCILFGTGTAGLPAFSRAFTCLRSALTKVISGPCPARGLSRNKKRYMFELWTADSPGKLNSGYYFDYDLSADFCEFFFIIFHSVFPVIFSKSSRKRTGICMESCKMLMMPIISSVNSRKNK